MARERSPNYPALSLDQAVVALKQLYDKERRTPVTGDVLAKALGYSSNTGNLSGAALSKIASLRQYGLVEKAAQGKLKVSDGALDFVLHSPGSAEYMAAARKAALAPSLFSDLWSQYGEASDDSLRAYLVKERQFSEEGAAKLIRSFRDTVAFAKLPEQGYNDREEQEEFVERERSEAAKPLARQDGRPSREMHELFDKPDRGGSKVAYSWPLPDELDAHVSFSGKPTRRAVERLIAYLQFMREDIPEPPSQRLRGWDAVGADGESEEG